MPTLNRQELIGYVGSVKELRYSAGEEPTAFCDVSVATDHMSRGAKVTTWHRCRFIGARAESVHRHSQPGTFIYVVGRTEHQKYDGRQYALVVVEKFLILADGVWPEAFMDQVKPTHRPKTAADIEMPKGDDSDPLENRKPADPGATGDPEAPFEDDLSGI